EAFARTYWPDGADPLGEQILIGGGRGVMRPLAGEPARLIVGVVGDTRAAGLTREARPYVYIPRAQIPDALSTFDLAQTPLGWVVRTHTDPGTVAATVRDELRRATGLAVTEVRPMSDILSTSTSRERLNMLLMSVFAAAALLLAVIGVYGLLAYSVQQRTREIGIRLALGADAREVGNMVL